MSVTLVRIQCTLRTKGDEIIFHPLFLFPKFLYICAIMATSANVIDYTIEKNHEPVGYFHKNIMCKYPEYSDLLKYQPLYEHTITCSWYDEEEEFWEDEPENLEVFLSKMIRFDKKIKEFFETRSTKRVFNENDPYGEENWE
jgi:hypothetical protein